VDEETGGVPMLINAACDLVGANFSDLILPFDEFACAKVLRTWSVIDWCQYDPEALTGIWEHTQIIKVVNPQGPEGEFLTAQTEFCENDPVVSYDPAAGCFADLQLGPRAEDDCTPSADLIWSYTLDLWSDGADLAQSAEFTGPVQGAILDGEVLEITVTFPSIPFNDADDADQTHTIIWSLRDQCGNTTEIPQVFRLLDCKLPTPVCLDLVAPFDSLGGSVTIPASAFDASSSDNCTPSGELIFTYGTYGGGPEYTFTCADVIANGSELLDVDVVVSDAYGNTSSCVVELLLENGNSFCGITMASVSGILSTETGEVISSSEVHLMDGTTMVDQVASQANGLFAFQTVPNGDYVMEPYKNDGVLNGVSTLDLIRMQKHLLGLDPFTTPYQMIAADVNNSSHVSAVDILALRRVLLGVDTVFPANTSWRFVPQDFVFSDPLTPWPFAEVMELDLHGDITDANFTGIKVGDVNGSYVANATAIETRSQEDVRLITEDRWLTAGEPARIVMSLEEPLIMEGVQFVLAGEQLIFNKIEGIGVPLLDSHVALHRDHSALSWHAQTPLRHDGPLIAVTVTPRKSGMLSAMLRLNEQRLPAELYVPVSGGWIIRPVKLDLQQREYDFALQQNVPNPWDETTSIHFELPAAMEVRLDVFDITGRTLLSTTASGHAGMNVIELKSAEFPARGLLYYRLEAGPFSGVRKMVRH
ncbi:MAG: dockerin type I domain-containing protein, partial [Saprospiraceae bacterium]|nr:dockerin type I domain-containing protein [Saprospiraceae bacterium]